MTHRTTKARRLTEAGWTYVAGWAPPGLKDKAAATQRTLNAAAAEAERVGATQIRKPGRRKPQ